MSVGEQSLKRSFSRLQRLTEINTQDFLASFGVGETGWRRKGLEALSWLPARRFARQMLAYDLDVAERGLHQASRRILSGYVKGLMIEGQENVPAHGPLLILSNHPGICDMLALFSAIPRIDVSIVAARRPFLQTLPAISDHLIYVSEEAGQRAGVVRRVVQRLRGGGAVLICPAGEIEPDPACMPGALESLRKWSQSTAIFARLVPELKIVVAIVSGVIWPAATYNPLTCLRREQKDRERLGAALQVFVQTLLPFYRPVAPWVSFGEAVSPTGVASGDDGGALQEVILEQARHLIERVYQRRPRREEFAVDPGDDIRNTTQV